MHNWHCIYLLDRQVGVKSHFVHQLHLVISSTHPKQPYCSVLGNYPPNAPVLSMEAKRLIPWWSPPNSIRIKEEPPRAYHVDHSCGWSLALTPISNAWSQTQVPLYWKKSTKMIPFICISSMVNYQMETLKWKSEVCSLTRSGENKSIQILQLTWYHVKHGCFQ